MIKCEHVARGMHPVEIGLSSNVGIIVRWRQGQGHFGGQNVGHCKKRQNCPRKGGFVPYLLYVFSWKTVPCYTSYIKEHCGAYFMALRRIVIELCSFYEDTDNIGSV